MSMTNFIQRRLGSSAGAARRLAALWLRRRWLLAAVPAWAADTLNWDTNRNQVSADIKSGKLLPLLEQIASATGWHVFVEPDTGSHRFRQIRQSAAGRSPAPAARRSELRSGSRHQRQPEALRLPHR